MFISRVEVHNYRNFSYLDLRLQPVTVIIGPNKCGKTNLLRAIRLALDPNLPSSARRLSASDFWDGLAAPFNGQEISVSVELQGDDESMFMLSDALISDRPKIARLTYRFRPKATTESKDRYQPAEYEYVWHQGPDERMNQSTSQVSSSSLQSLSFELLDALRNTEDLLAAWSRSPLRPLLEGLAIDPEFLQEVASNIQSQSQVLVNRDDVNGLIQGVEEHSTAMVGSFFGIGSTLDVVSENPEELVRSIKLFVDGDSQRPISHASLGVQNILYFALLLERINREGSSRSKQTILALEEPEAHTHPHVQRAIFRYFISNADALLVTTHSPHIASVADLQSVVVLRHVPQQGVKGFSLQNLLESGRLSPNDVLDLQRYLDVTRAELLFARGVILVEGLAELYVIPSFASAMGFNLDHLGISVVSVHGTDFSPFARLLSAEGFSIPYVVITDGDAAIRLYDDEEEETPPGIRRGHRLLTEIPSLAGNQELSQAVQSQNWPDAVNILKRAGIFVGNQTLELDLLPLYEDDMVDVYGELVRSDRARERFRAAASRATSGDIAGMQEVLARIEQKGKGRFAQKLAPHLTPDRCPPYVRDAITHIVSARRQEPEETKLMTNETDNDLPF